MEGTIMFTLKKVRLWITLIAILTILTSSTSVFAFRSGPPEKRNGSTASEGNSCRNCHNNTVGTGIVEILGVPTIYRPGEFYNITVRVHDKTQSGAGFQISVEDANGTHVGFLVVSDLTNTQLNGGFINHTSSGVSNAIANWASLGNAAEYNVLWEAPGMDIGPITFWAAGNAINNNFSNTGDIVYLTNTIATFGPSVPTVSQWGMLVMLIMVMTAATLVIIRNQTSVVK